MSPTLLWRAVDRAGRDTASIGAQVATWPGVRAAWRSWLKHRFLNESGACFGVFRSFEEALAAAPQNRPLGYDHPAAAGMYRRFMERPQPNDYAVGFWLHRNLKPGSVVFDFGGHVGVKYYALQHVMPMPDGLRWIVYDVPAVLAAGRQLAEERGAGRLEFTESLERASGADVFLALGSLQYVETPLPALLSRLDVLPSTVTVSSTPMSDHPRYVTLQNIGTAVCPYLVENRRELQEGLERIGYRLVHAWTNPDKRCSVLDRPDRSVAGYTSLHFSRAGAA